MPGHFSASAAAGGRQPMQVLPAGSTATILVALPLLLFVFMPRPPVAGSHLLAYPILGAILFLLLLHLLPRRGSIDLRLAGILLLLLLLNATVALSFLVNAGQLRARGPVELFRVALFAIFLLYGFLIADFAGSERVRRGLRVAAYTILLGQLVISVSQIAGGGFFDLIYSEEKSRPLGSLVRATGSLGNPNTLAWLAAQAGIIVLLLEPSRLRFIGPIAGGLLVVASGSRSLLLLFPAMAMCAVFLAGGAQPRKWRTLVLLGGGITAAFFAVVYLGARFLPYLRQLRLLFASGSLVAVNSMRARVVAWESAYREFVAGGWQSWMVGLGGPESTTVIDNDFLYVFFKFGAVGLLVHLLLVGCLAILLYRRRRNVVAVIGLEYLLFALVWGFAADTLGGWTVPLLLYFLVGLALALGHDSSDLQPVHPKP